MKRVGFFDGVFEAAGVLGERGRACREVLEAHESSGLEAREHQTEVGALEEVQAVLAKEVVGVGPKISGELLVELRDLPSAELSVGVVGTGRAGHKHLHLASELCNEVRDDLEQHVDLLLVDNAADGAEQQEVVVEGGQAKVCLLDAAFVRRCASKSQPPKNRSTPRCKPNLSRLFE